MHRFLHRSWEVIHLSRCTNRPSSLVVVVVMVVGVAAAAATAATAGVGVGVGVRVVFTDSTLACDP